MLNSENVSFLTVALLIYAYENDGQIDVFKFMEDTEYSEPAIMDTLEQMQLLELVTQDIPFHLTAYGHTVTERYYKNTKEQLRFLMLLAKSRMVLIWK